MQAQTLAYAGKYNAPDVEQMLAGDCDLADPVDDDSGQSWKGRREPRPAIPVIEYFSYETDPLGRLEWVNRWRVVRCGGCCRAVVCVRDWRRPQTF